MGFRPPPIQSDPDAELRLECAVLIKRICELTGDTSTEAVVHDALTLHLDALQALVKRPPGRPYRPTSPPKGAA